MLRAFMYGVYLQWKLDFRNKGILLTYYVIPLIFFGFMGAIFTSINPLSKETLIQSMSVFGVTMGSFLGAPTSLVELYGSEIKKAYKIGGIPLWVPALNSLISAFVHLFFMSIVIFLVAPIAFNAKIPSNVPVFLFSLAFFIIVSLLIGTVLGLTIKNTSKLTMLSQLLFLPSLMLSGMMFPATMLPEIMQTIGKIFPATWALSIMTSNDVSFNLYLPLVIMLLSLISINGWVLNKLRNE